MWHPGQILAKPKSPSSYRRDKSPMSTTAKIDECCGLQTSENVLALPICYMPQFNLRLEFISTYEESFKSSRRHRVAYPMVPDVAMLAELRLISATLKLPKRSKPSAQTKREPNSAFVPSATSLLALPANKVRPDAYLNENHLHVAFRLLYNRVHGVKYLHLAKSIHLDRDRNAKFTE
jgi:hypothetical protein